MLVILLLPFAVISVLVVVELFRPVPRRYVDRFLRRYPVHLTEANGPMVLRRLARVRAARTLGGLGGAVVAVLAGVRGSSVNIVFIAVGYLLGAVLAEVPSGRDRAAAQRPAASLVPRRLRDYLPRWLVCAPVSVTTLTLVIVAAGAIGARRADAEVQSAGRGVTGLATMALTTVLTVVIARAILYRRQPYTTAEMVSADDALRAASLHCVCGGGLAITAIVGSVLVWNVGSFSDVQALRWVAPWLGLALMFTAYFAWFAARVGPWLVRRQYYTPMVQPS